MTMDWMDAKFTLNAIQKKHGPDSEEIMKRLFALGLARSGCGPVGEDPVQGVDLDVVHEETGKKRTFVVKFSTSLEVIVEDENQQGINRRADEGFEAYYAVLCMPVANEGWIVSPGDRFKAGKHKSIGFLRRRDEDLSGEINDAFLGVLDEAGDGLLKCGPGTALQFLEEQHNH